MIVHESMSRLDAGWNAWELAEWPLSFICDHLKCLSMQQWYRKKLLAKSWLFLASSDCKKTSGYPWSELSDLTNPFIGQRSHPKSTYSPSLPWVWVLLLPPFEADSIPSRMRPRNGDHSDACSTSLALVLILQTDSPIRKPFLTPNSLSNQSPCFWLSGISNCPSAFAIALRARQAIVLKIKPKERLDICQNIE